MRIRLPRRPILRDSFVAALVWLVLSAFALALPGCGVVHTIAWDPPLSFEYSNPVSDAPGAPSEKLTITWRDRLRSFPVAPRPPASQPSPPVSD